MRRTLLFQSIFYWVCLAVICVACSDARPELVVPVHPNVIKTPTFIPAGAPRIIKIDTCVPPLAVPIINTDSAQFNVYWGNTKRLMTFRRPEITAASFFIPMRNYNMDRGLALNAITGSFEDKEGNLWFATTGGGLTKYNGKTSITFTGAEGLGNNGGENIAEDNEGNIWYFGGGMAKYDGRSIVNFTKVNGLLSNEPRTMIPLKNGEYIIPTRDGLSKFDGRHFTNF